MPTTIVDISERAVDVVHDSRIETAELVHDAQEKLEALRVVFWTSAIAEALS